MKDISTLARESVQRLTPYQSARRIGGTGDTWLNANESPKSESYSLDCERLNRYPEFQPDELINRYADYANVSTEQLITTRGADEAIELLIRTFCEPKEDSILINTPTYGMYEVSAETCGVNIIKQPLNEDFSPNYTAIKSQLSQTKIVFLCAPNNPTGNLIERTKLIDLLEAASNTIVVVDEAYIEFCADNTQTDLISKYTNLVILRTLSKAFALASIRCGFALADKGIIDLMLKVIPPYPVPEPVAQIAIQALSQVGIARMEQQVQQLNELRESFKDALILLPNVRRVFPTTGNFLLAEFTDSKVVFEGMSQKGIILRDFSSKPMLKNCIRITVGSPQEMDYTLTALKSLL